MFSLRVRSILMISVLHFSTFLFWLQGLYLLQDKEYMWLGVWVMSSLVLSVTIKRDFELALIE